jgi:hypothetical protein
VTAKALEYAEVKLGVHKVHTEALEARESLDKILTELGEARDRKRDLEFRLSDREQELATAEWVKHPDMAQNRMEKHLKAAFFADDAWRELREQLGKAAGDVEGSEYDRAIAEADIRIAVARMQELQGYLNYLAAVKTASVTS